MGATGQRNNVILSEHGGLLAAVGTSPCVCDLDSTEVLFHITARFPVRFISDGAYVNRYPLMVDEHHVGAAYLVAYHPHSTV